MRRFWASLLVVPVLVAALAAPAAAVSPRSGESIVIPQGEVLDDDLIAMGRTITINGTVNGDVIALGEEVLVTGRIDGNLISAGAAVTVQGEVTGSLIGAAETVQVDGTVGGSQIAAGANILVGEDGAIGRSLIAAGERLDQMGTVGRGVLFSGARLNLAGEVGGEVQASVENVNIRSTARIAGPVNYRSPNEALVEEGAQIGALNQSVVPEKPKEGLNRRFHPVRTLLKFAGFVLVGLIILALMPRQRSRFTRQLVNKPWQAPLAGFLIMVATPAAVGILMLTVIGIPLGLMATLAFPVAVYLSQVLVSWSVGEMLSERVGFLRNQNWAPLFLVGALITTVLTQIPYVQVLARAAAVLYGLGGLWFLATQRSESTEV